LFGGALTDMRELGVHRSMSLQVIFGSSVMMIMGASLVYPVLPVIAEAFDIGDGNIGLVLTAFTVPAIFLSPVAGMAIDLRGRKQVLVASLLLYGASGLAIVLVDTLPMLLALRFLQGVAYAGIMPLVVVLIGDTFAKEQETTAQGVKVVLDRMALLVIPAVAGGLGAIAWQLPFALYAAALPLGLAAWRWLPEPAIEKRSHAPTYVREVFRASMHVRSLTIFSMSSMRFFLEMSFFIYVPLYAIDRLGVEVSRGGLLFTVFAIGSIVTAGLVGTIARRFERFSIVIAAFTLQGICLALASVATSVWTMGVVMLVFGLANGVISPAQKSLLTQSVVGSVRGGFVAADRISQNTAKSLAPLIAGALVVATSIETMFQVMSLVAFGWAGAVSVLRVRGALRAGSSEPAAVGQENS
jgi:MFS transporter, ACDE family, multidrug resistance protein